MPSPTIGDLYLLYQAMLGLINEARADQGLSLVVLGDNPAAQAHAEDMLENCYNSHWNLEGVSSTTRYSFAGGYQANAENVRGSNYCRESGLVDLNEKVQSHMDGWMRSPGHRDAILDPTYRKVNIGLAWDAHQMRAVLQFEGDYVQYSVLPTIGGGGIFVMEGSLYNGAGFYTTRTDLRVVIAHYPMPTPLTVGQLAHAYGGRLGLRAAELRPPPVPGNHYTAHERVQVREYSNSPHDFSPDLPAPQSSGESRDLWLKAKLAPKKEIEVTTYLVTASQWVVDTDTGDFRVVADVSKMLDHYGPGVYDIIVFGLIDDRVSIVSGYSILWEGE